MITVEDIRKLILSMPGDSTRRCWQVQRDQLAELLDMKPAGVNGWVYRRDRKIPQTGPTGIKLREMLAELETEYEKDQRKTAHNL